MKLETEKLTLDLRSLSKGLNTGTFAVPMMTVDWKIEDASPADGTGTLELSVDLQEVTVTCTGRLIAVFTTPCSRCLAPVRFSVSEEISREYSLVPGRPDDDDERETVPGTGRLDLIDAVREAVILSIPGKSLCSPDCPGIEYI